MVNGTTMAGRTEEVTGFSESPFSLRLLTEGDRLAMQQATTEASQVLEEAVVAMAVAARRALSSVQQLEAALVGLDQAAGTGDCVRGRRVVPVTSRMAASRAALSRREREVLALVAEGRSNKAIAEALFVSPNTVKTHIASLMTKLHADSRAQLAAIAARQEDNAMRRPHSALDRTRMLRRRPLADTG
jgi:DNA-binding CsgD family transcriptional regulator